MWRASRGVLGRLEASRLVRDELRVALAADAVGTYDIEEADAYRARGVRSARLVALTLPPVAQVDVAASTPRLVLMGTAGLAAQPGGLPPRVGLWPRIAGGIADAELCVIGAKKPGAPDAEVSGRSS